MYILDSVDNDQQLPRGGTSMPSPDSIYFLLNILTLLVQWIFIVIRLHLLLTIQNNPSKCVLILS